METNNTNPTQSPASGNTIPWLIRALLLLAAGLSFTQAYSSLSHAVVLGCSSASGCQTALASRWAQWWGMPVGIIGGVVYLALLATTTRAGIRWRISPQRIGAVLCLVVFGAAGWFLALQAFVLQAWCALCLTIHACAVVAALLWFKARPRLASEDSGTGPAAIEWRKSLALATGALAILIAGQLLGKAGGQVVRVTAATTATAPGANVPRKLILHAGRLELDLADLPLLGSPAAPHIAVCLFDFTCPYCRQLHADLQQLQQVNQDVFAVVFLPVPMERSCNPNIAQTENRHRHACDYARTAMAVAHGAPDHFARYSEWFLTATTLPNPSAARDMAAQMMGGDALATTLAGRWPEEQIRRGVALFELNLQITGQDELPQLLAGSKLTFGPFADRTESLRRHLSREFGRELRP